MQKVEIPLHALSGAVGVDALAFRRREVIDAPPANLKADECKQ